MPGPNYTGSDKGYYAQTALVQFTAVKGGTVDESCTAITATGDSVLGVVQQTVAAADVTPFPKQAANIRKEGITKGLLGTGGITRWAPVMIDATGKFVAAGGTGTRMVGRAESAGAAGDIVDIWLIPDGRVP